jgi:FAD/FMN-containing dehydrogenase
MFEFQLHPVGPEVAFANVMYPIESARAVLAAHERFIEADSGAVSSLAVLGHVPPVDDFAPGLHGRPFIAVLAVHAGDVETGMAALAPLRELAPPLVDMSAAMPFVEVQKVFDAEYPTGHRYYWKSARLERLGAGTIDALVEALERAPSAHSTIDVWLNGGAMEAVPADATAFGSRAVPYLLSPEANWDNPADDDANVDWARSVLAAAGTDRAAGSYLNFPGFLEEGDALVRSSFGPTYNRLALLKAEYDPGNVFRRNQNVRPADS